MSLENRKENHPLLTFAIVVSLTACSANPTLVPSTSVSATDTGSVPSTGLGAPVFQNPAATTPPIENGTPTPTPAPTAAPIPISTDNPEPVNPTSAPVLPTPMATSVATPSATIAPNGVTANISLPTLYDCSNRFTEEIESNLENATALTLVLNSFENGRFVVEKNSVDLLDSLLNTKQLVFSIPAGSLNDGRYQVFVCASSFRDFCDERNSLLENASIRLRTLNGVTSAYWNEMRGMDAPYILFGLNPDLDRLHHHKDSLCDQVHSPLMIDLSGQGILLSSPVDGMSFDITGDGIAEKISCPESKGLYFLSLPDQNGQIESIQQLFGNDTVGPDRKKSANGFDALKKYDLNHDNRLDSKDPVFNQLKLWRSADCNGPSGKEELFSLKEKGILGIDLNYQDIYEQDVYGNETKERSLVETLTGLKRIFDVWFRPI